MVYGMYAHYQVCTADIVPEFGIDLHKQPAPALLHTPASSLSNLFIRCHRIDATHYSTMSHSQSQYLIEQTSRGPRSAPFSRYLLEAFCHLLEWMLCGINVANSILRCALHFGVDLGTSPNLILPRAGCSTVKLRLGSSVTFVGLL